MNIAKIISKGIYGKMGSLVTLTIEYPHKSISGFDFTGRPMRDTVSKHHTAVGCNREEAAEKAKQFLNVEIYEANTVIKQPYRSNTRYQGNRSL